ncbi:MAG: lytic murein transglycosylase B [Pseudomonadales bacterium]
MRHKRILILRVLLSAFAIVWIVMASARADYAERPEVQQFISELRINDGFDAEVLQSVFQQARYKQSIIDAISRPAERVLKWDGYQDIFLTDRRFRQGLAFEASHRELFTKAEARWGVDRWTILAILGVETSYGRNKGSYRVIDALSTLAFDYPPRAKFFKKELRELFLLAREQDKSVVDLLGSYAGAMGYGQFIPSSYRAYAVDFNDDAFIDIWDEPADAIASIANYLSVHGWEPAKPVLREIASPNDIPEALLNKQLKPHLSAAVLIDYGVEPSLLGDIEPGVLLNPLRFEGKAGSEYWLGYPNFYAITRYNHSRLYAMAIYQLSEQLRKGSKQ